jgi:hypothetical protein
MTTVDFLPFANDASAANVVTQVDYLAAASGSGYVQNGFPSGRADSNKANKALRQSSVMVAAIAQFISAKLSADVLDSGGASSVTALTSQFLQALQLACLPNNSILSWDAVNSILQISSAGSLRIGVATNAANSKAQIAGSSFVVANNASSSALNGSVAYDYYNGGSSPSYSGAYLEYFGTSYAGNAFGITAANQGTLVFQNTSMGVIGSNGCDVCVSPNSSPSAYFKASGNVGIGTSTPAQKLSVAGVIESTSGGIKFPDGTSLATWDADLTAIAALSGTGLATRTAANTWATRTIAVTSGHGAIANGDGVAGNPTISIPALMRQAVTASSSTLNIDMSLGWNVALTLNATVTSFTVSNWPASGVLGKLTLEVTNGGSYNITGYPGTTKYWTDGAIPTMTTSGRDTVILTSGDGGTVFRNYQASQNMS